MQICIYIYLYLHIRTHTHICVYSVSHPKIFFHDPNHFECVNFREETAAVSLLLHCSRFGGCAVDASDGFMGDISDREILWMEEILHQLMDGFSHY